MNDCLFNLLSRVLSEMAHWLLSSHGGFDPVVVFSDIGVHAWNTCQILMRVQILMSQIFICFMCVQMRKVWVLHRMSRKVEVKSFVYCLML